MYVGSQSSNAQGVDSYLSNGAGGRPEGLRVEDARGRGLPDGPARAVEPEVPVRVQGPEAVRQGPGQQGPADALKRS